MIDQALRTHAARGSRVVVDVAGVKTPEQARAIADGLAALPRVGRAAVKTIGGGGAIIDVVVAGGDGMALALDVGDARVPVTVEAVTPAALRLRAAP